MRTMKTLQIEYTKLNSLLFLKPMNVTHWLALSPIQKFLPNLLGTTSRKHGILLAKEPRHLVVWFTYLQMLARNFMHAYYSLLLRMFEVFWTSEPSTTQYSQHIKMHAWHEACLQMTMDGSELWKMAGI
jgi:hypothetical protein